MGSGAQTFTSYSAWCRKSNSVFYILGIGIAIRSKLASVRVWVQDMLDPKSLQPHRLIGQVKEACNYLTSLAGP